MTLNMHRLEVVNTAIDDLIPHPNNANRGDMPAIIESIRVNGFYSPIIVQKSTGYVIAGNHRLAAARELGASEVPAVFLDVNDSEATRIMLVDNRSTRLGHDDVEALSIALVELSDSDAGLLGTGFSEADLRDLLILDDNPPEFGGVGGAGQSTDEKKVAKWSAEPAEDMDGACEGVMIRLNDFSPLTASDYNQIRAALGLEEASLDEIRTSGITDWE